ncbi:SGNH/GDSL hydrolase family protein [Robertkochia sediminum]|uniref:lipase n=1 Tax=Robertkochia sediminum TaxID=2785326 RepID=UPI00193253A2|nr:lipase [Robertkochia sediminum]MBL7472954.1 lipase [Robertkochia sediminum]
MNPRNISVFLIASLLLMFGITFLSEGHVVKEGEEEDGFMVFDQVVKYPTTETFMMAGKVEHPNTESIDSIVANIAQVVVEEEAPEEAVKEPVVDYRKIDTSRIKRMDWPANKQEVIAKLKKQLSSGNCRIIHYGDSQLEGDRISAYVRNRLQGIYGGEGPGFVPVKQLYHQLKAKVTPSENWLRFAAFDPKHEKFDHKKYGAFTSVSRFTPYIHKDSVSLDTIEVTEASIAVAVAPTRYKRLRKFTHVDLHYGHAQTPLSIEVYQKDSLIKKDSFPADLSYHKYRIDLKTPPKDLKIVMRSKISPDFYGLTLDGDKGIALDNVAMRGASGTVFRKLDRENFNAMIRELDPKVFIFQYGGNSVPYMKTEEAIDRYVKYVMSNVSWVRRMRADASVIFIGPSDMSTLQDGNYVSYKHLPYLNNKLREACVTNGIAYWSMFEAMGGANAMQHWVDQELAKSDYTHFSSSGTKVISELFFTALSLDLNE